MNSDTYLGNRAEASSYWINKQFEVLWDISTNSVLEHDRGTTGSKADVIYGTSLSQLCVGNDRDRSSTEGLSFYGLFEAPKFKFICNHDVLIELQLKGGHFQDKDDSFPTGIEKFEGFTCSFRVPFHEQISDITFSTPTEVDTCEAKFFVFDFEAATYVQELSGFPSGHRMSYSEVDRKQRVIVKYITAEYLPFLRKARYHHILSLPDFDNLTPTNHTDFSLISNVKIDVSSIYGINLESINTFLKDRWHEVDDELERDHDLSLYDRFALVEHQAACNEFHFHTYFEPPQVRLLCTKEVIYSIDVLDLHVYLDGGFNGEAKHIFSKWKLDFIVDVQFVEEEEGNVRRLKVVDFSKSRFYETTSSFGVGTTVIEEALFIKIRTAFISYISRQYTPSLGGHHDYIFRSDVPTINEGKKEEDFEFANEAIRERVTITNTFGFDIMTAITQGTINYDFHSRWEASRISESCLSHWKYKDFVEARFGAPWIRLPADSSENTVVLYLNILAGSISSLDSSKKSFVGERREFAACRLAFEIKLKVREYAKRHPVSDAFFKSRGSTDEFVHNQLILDVKSARFVEYLSRHPMRSKREALIHAITRFYLPQFRREGYHVLYTVPTLKATRKPESGVSFAPSSFSFQFYSGSEDSDDPFEISDSGHQRASGQRNMIVICSMLDHQRAPPFPLPRFSWVLGSSFEEYAFSGSFALSRSVFLDGWLLPKLQRVTLRTTLVPIVGGDAGKWNLDLVTMEACGWSRGDWREVGVRGRGIEFEHRNKDSWSYEHLGDADDLHNGVHSVSCDTVNTLAIPTSSDGGECTIKLNGTITLYLEFKDPGSLRTRSTTSAASWSSDIIISSSSSGQDLEVSSTSSHDVSDEPGFPGDFGTTIDSVNPGTLLRERLRDVGGFIGKSVVEDLKALFSGVWPFFYSGEHGYSLCNLVFNERGDVSFDLKAPVDAGQSIALGRSLQQNWKKWIKLSN